MPRGVLVIQTDPKIGQERAFEEFYNDIHLREVAETPGFVLGRRFAALHGDGLPARPEGEWLSNLTIYDLEADDLAASYRTLLARELTLRDVFSDVRPYRRQLFEQVFEARP
jgi:hypothetical protein